ncbi:MAG: CRISPR-associated endoribonuclease Cas6 [Cyclobacteriaceae bacterium]
MRFKLILHITSSKRVLPLNYQYPLHAWIYRTIEQADADFSRFLHDEGYASGSKKFKLFTFSPLSCRPYKIFRQEERIAFQGDEISLQISFMIDQAAEKFIMGLFMGQRFSLGDPISQADFEVVRIEALPRPEFKEKMRYRCLSPVVISVMETGKAHAQYKGPAHPEYEKLFLNHLAEKYKAVPQLAGSIPDSPQDWQFRLLSKPRQKLIHIKQHTEAATKVRGYQYDFELTAPAEVQEMGYYAGFGEKNSLGFGMGNKLND